MANNIKVMGSIKNFLERMKAQDSDIPEELAQDALEMVEEVKDALCEDEEKAEEIVEEKKTEDETEEKEIEKKVEDAMTKVLRNYGLIKDGSMEALDELENKLGEDKSEDADGEEKVTEDPEKINDSARLAILRDVKPIIASVKDSKQRKILADSFAKAIGMARDTADYGSILSATKSSAKDSMAKKQTKMNDNDYDFGMEIARRFNPHYMKEEK